MSLLVSDTSGSSSSASSGESMSDALLGVVITSESSLRDRQMARIQAAASSAGESMVEDMFMSII